MELKLQVGYFLSGLLYVTHILVQGIDQASELVARTVTMYESKPSQFTAL